MREHQQDAGTRILFFLRQGFQGLDGLVEVSALQIDVGQFHADAGIVIGNRQCTLQIARAFFDVAALYGHLTDHGQQAGIVPIGERRLQGLHGQVRLAAFEAGGRQQHHGLGLAGGPGHIAIQIELGLFIVPLAIVDGPQQQQAGQVIGDLFEHLGQVILGGGKIPQLECEQSP